VSNGIDRRRFMQPVLAGLQLLISRTRLGRAFRSTADDPEAASLVGLDHRHVYAMATAIALATVAVAGVFLGIRTTFAPSVGPTRLIFAFEAVVIGGLGSLWGTLLGGLVLGVAQTSGCSAPPAGACSPATWCSWRSWRSARRACSAGRCPRDPEGFGPGGTGGPRGVPRSTGPKGVRR
jgi:hypothetical protein